MAETLRVLSGTPYTASVRLEEDGNYIVVVTRPAREREVKAFHGSTEVLDPIEIIGKRYVYPMTSKNDLERIVQEIINTDTPPIFGDFVGERN